jgi:hypothetical protein
MASAELFARKALGMRLLQPLLTLAQKPLNVLKAINSVRREA